MKIGDQVNFETENGQKSGVIHGIRTAENNDGKEATISYLVDVGEAVYTQDQFDKKGKEIDPFIQPEMVDVIPDNISLA